MLAVFVQQPHGDLLVVTVVDARPPRRTQPPPTLGFAFHERQDPAPSGVTFSSSTPVIIRVALVMVTTMEPPLLLKPISTFSASRWDAYSASRATWWSLAVC